jgi:hypothetical protein
VSPQATQNGHRRRLSSKPERKPAHVANVASWLLATIPRQSPQYCERKPLLQKQRNAKRRAKHLAKMDALTQKIILIPAACDNFYASCKKGLDGPADTVAIQGSHNEEALHDHQKSRLS